MTATNTGGSTTVSLSITVNDVAPAGLAYVTNPANYTTGTAIAPNTASSTGGAVVSYGVSPALPAGLSMNTTTGAISGTPTAVAAAAGYTVTATNTGGSTQATVTITVTLGAPTNLAYATNPASYTRNTVIAPNTPSNGGGAVVSYAVSPALPAGLALHPTTGVVSGTPTTVTATAAYTVTATNGAGSTQVALSITVIEPTLVSVAVSPASGDVTAGGSSLPLTARATYSDASTTDVTSSATWTTTAAGQVDVTTGGLASAPLAARVGTAWHGDGVLRWSAGERDPAGGPGPGGGAAPRERPPGPAAVVPRQHRPDGLFRPRRNCWSRPPAHERDGPRPARGRREGGGGGLGSRDRPPGPRRQRRPRILELRERHERPDRIHRLDRG